MIKIPWNSFKFQYLILCFHMFDPVIDFIKKDSGLNVHFKIKIEILENGSTPKDVTSLLILPKITVFLLFLNGL